MRAKPSIAKKPAEHVVRISGGRPGGISRPGTRSGSCWKACAAMTQYC
jgi:hypothetical protein